jgi:hypothetical protein
MSEERLEDYKKIFTSQRTEASCNQWGQLDQAAQESAQLILQAEARFHKSDIASDLDILLDMAESLLPLPSRITENVVISLALQRDSSLLRCRIAGKKDDNEYVIAYADTALRYMEDLKVHVDKLDPKDKDNLLLRSVIHGMGSLEAVALGYLGYGLMKQSKYALAVPILERARQRFDSLGDSLTIGEKEKSVMVRKCQSYSYQQRAASHVNPPPIIKFPRTTHLVDMGASTVDDLVSDVAGIQHVCNGTTQVVIEEKIDGANLGITICPKSGKLLAQNRSHYISSGEHAQFSRLTEWLAEHEEALKQVLLHTHVAGTSFASEWILYGEWMVARHSIPYHMLPGFFVAFDLYEKNTRRFLSRRHFHRIMKGVGIPVAPTMCVRSFGPYPEQNAEDLFCKDVLSLLESKSVFRSDDGPVEGLVLRLDDRDWLQDRFKIVRSDFILGCEGTHWSRRDVEKQRLVFEFSKTYLETCYPFAADEV